MFALSLIRIASAAPEMIPEEAWAAAQTAPDSSVGIEVPLRDGGSFRMADQKGKRVIMSFWASWCGPCRKELPALEIWAKSHPEVKILAVNVDRGKADAEKFISSVKFDLPVAFDPDAKELGRFGVTSMPTMFLFDSTGALVFRHSGYGESTGFTELDAALKGAK